MVRKKQSFIFLFLNCLILSLLLSFPSLLFATDIEGVLKKLSYPERLTIISTSDNPEISITAQPEKKGQVTVLNVSDCDTVTIGTHAYMFHKKEDAIKIRYVKHDTKEVAVQSLTVDNPFRSTDGYTIKPLCSTITISHPTENVLIQNDKGHLLYKTEKSDSKLILKKIPLKDKSDVIFVLKDGSGNKINKNYGVFSVDSDFSIGNLTGYVLKTDKELPFDVFFDCQVEKADTTTYMVCTEKPDFDRFSEKFKEIKEVEDIPVCKKPAKDCLKEESKVKIHSTLDSKWHIAETEKYYGFVSAEDLKNWEEIQAEKKLLGQVLSLDFRNVPLKDAMVSLCAQAKVNIILDKEVDSNLSVTAAYEGVSLEDALKTITYGLDLSYKKQGNIFVITPFEEKYIDVNKLLSEETSSTSTSTTQPFSQTQDNSASSQQLNQPYQSTTSSGISSQQAIYGGDFGGYIDNVITNLEKILSSEGVITYMPTGLIYVKDYPSYVRAVERILNIDDERREEINLKITLVRLDYKKEYSTGVDWSVILGGAKDSLPVQVDIGTRFLGSLIGDNDAASVKITNSKSSITSIVKAMSQYADVDIVHTWETRAISGTVLPFELTQDVWYSQGRVVQVIDNQTITSDVINKESVGLRILLNPLLQQEGRYLVNTKIELSNIVGFQKVGDQEMPQTERNFLKIPIKMEKEDTVVISGFKIKNQDSQSGGIPLLARLPVFKYLFGYTKTTDRLSELSVVISIAEKPKSRSIDLARRVSN
ncbi:MAG: hypothetical protein IBX72_13410 [Nitrospirae bacterium]|nr:hypothetical protein [Nitrospirota bacterium]